MWKRATEMAQWTWAQQQGVSYFVGRADWSNYWESWFEHQLKLRLEALDGFRSEIEDYRQHDLPVPKLLKEGARGMEAEANDIRDFLDAVKETRVSQGRSTMRDRIWMSYEYC